MTWLTGCAILLLFISAVTGLVLAGSYWRQLNASEATAEEWRLAYQQATADLQWATTQLAGMAQYFATSPGESILPEHVSVLEAEPPEDEPTQLMTLPGLTAPVPVVPPFVRKLSDDEAAAARTMHDSFGVSWKELGKALKVSDSTVRRAVARLAPAE